MMDETPHAEPVASSENESAVDEVVRKTPWWTISVGIHAIAVMVLTYLIVLQKPLESTEVVTIDTHCKRENPDVYPPTEREVERSLLVETKKVDPTIFKEPDPKNVDPTDEPFEKMVGHSEKKPANAPFRSKNVSSVIGTGRTAGGDHGGPFGGRLWRRSGRGAPPRVDSRTEDAVTNALRWLARHQHPDGSWEVQSHRDRCSAVRCAPSPRSEGDPDHDAGVTGLALLAFLGAGYSHLSHETFDGRRSGDIVRKAIEWIQYQQDAEGCIGPRRGRYMYNHTIGALALTESYGLTGSAFLRDPAQRAIGFLCDAQNRGKGWRYSYRCGDNDTSVTGWAVMALKSAELSDLRVPRSGYDGTRVWLDEVTEPSYARTGYTARGTGKVSCGHNQEFDHHESLTAIAVMSRIFMDKNRADPRLRLGCDLLVRDLPKWDGNAIDFYYWYYASLALFQFDGPKGESHWGRWDDPMKDALVKNQNPPSSGCPAGSWDPIDRWGCEGGRVYATAINAMTLEVYYRYANVFGRK